MAGVFRGIGGRVIVHGGLQDMFITSSSQWPVMSVTSRRASMEVVDESGKGVTSVLTSSLVNEDGNSSSLEVADPVGEVEEDAFSSSAVDVRLGLFERPAIVLTIVVTTFVLSWLPDAETLKAVTVLTNVVTPSLLDRLLCVAEIVVVEVLLA